MRYAGAEGFSAQQLKFRAGEFQGRQPFAALQWRVAEVAPPALANGKLTAPGKYEVTPLWTSAELTAFLPELTSPPDVVVAGRVYRVRARMKDPTGRWSHWSVPVEFTPTPWARNARLPSRSLAA